MNEKMPEYTYLDPNGHITTVTHRMLYTTAVTCTICDAEMWRRPPNISAVHWGGVAPSAGEYHPNFRRFLDTTEERRDKYEEKLDERHRHKQRDGDNLPG